MRATTARALRRPTNPRTGTAQMRTTSPGGSPRRRRSCLFGHITSCRSSRSAPSPGRRRCSTAASRCRGQAGCMHAAASLVTKRPLEAHSAAWIPCGCLGAAQILHWHGTHCRRDACCCLLAWCRMHAGTPWPGPQRPHSAQPADHGSWSQARSLLLPGRVSNRAWLGRHDWCQ